jgi:hypothetical protein
LNADSLRSCWAGWRLSAKEALDIYVNLAEEVFSKKTSKVLKGYGFDTTMLEKAIKDIVAQRLGQPDVLMIEDKDKGGKEGQGCKTYVEMLHPAKVIHNH